MSIFNKEVFNKDIEKHLNSCVEEICDEIIEESIEKIKKQIRSKTGSIAAQLFQFFELHTDNDRLIITVDFKNMEKM